MRSCYFFGKYICKYIYIAACALCGGITNQTQNQNNVWYFLDPPTDTRGLLPNPKNLKTYDLNLSTVTLCIWSFRTPTAIFCTVTKNWYTILGSLPGPPLPSPGGVPFTIRKHSQRPEEVSSVIINKNEKIKPFPNTETGKRGLSCSSRFKWKAMFQKHNRSKQLRKDKTKLCVGGKTVAVITRWIGSQCTGSKVEERPLLAREYRSLPPKCSIYWGSSQLDAHYCG